MSAPELLGRLVRNEHGAAFYVVDAIVDEDTGAPLIGLTTYPDGLPEVYVPHLRGWDVGLPVPAVLHGIAARILGVDRQTIIGWIRS